MVDFEASKPLLDELVDLLEQCLQRGEGAAPLTANTPLLGALPEFDSMSVASVLEAVEERFGVVVDDDDLSAEVFESVSSLVDFVQRLLAQS